MLGALVSGGGGRSDDRHAGARAPGRRRSASRCWRRPGSPTAGPDRPRGRGAPCPCRAGQRRGRSALWVRLSIANRSSGQATLPSHRTSSPRRAVAGPPSPSRRHRSSCLAGPIDAPDAGVAPARARADRIVPPPRADRSAGRARTPAAALLGPRPVGPLRRPRPGHASCNRRRPSGPAPPQPARSSASHRPTPAASHPGTLSRVMGSANSKESGPT